MTEISFLVALAGAADGALDPVFDDLAGRVGVPSVVWGALPHQPAVWSVRDAAPRLIGAEPGAAYFQPDPGLWKGLRLAPRAATAIGRGDPLARGCAEATRLGLSSHIRISVLRNARLAARHPGCAIRDVAGRPHPQDLCPSHPDVRAYVETMIADLARHGAETIRLDRLHFAGRSDLARPGGPSRGDAEACFCRHCQDALAAWCDVGAAVLQARRDEGMLPWPDQDAVGDGLPFIESCPPPPSPLAIYREAMSRSIAALTAGAARAARSHGMRVGFTAPARRSRTGTGVEEGLLAPVVDHFQIPCTAISRRSSVHAAAGERGTACLRPPRGHWVSTDDPGPSIAHARRGRIAELEFQHYHAMPDAFLDRVGDVLLSG